MRRYTARYDVIRRDIVAIRRDTARYRRDTTRYGAIRRDTAHLICQISRRIEMACIALRRDTARLTTDYRQIAFRIVKSRFVLRKRNVMKSGAICGTVISRYGGYLTARCTVSSYQLCHAFSSKHKGTELSHYYNVSDYNISGYNNPWHISQPQGIAMAFQQLLR